MGHRSQGQESFIFFFSFFPLDQMVVDYGTNVYRKLLGVHISCLGLKFWAYSLTHHKEFSFSKIFSRNLGRKIETFKGSFTKFIFIPTP